MDTSGRAGFSIASAGDIGVSANFAVSFTSCIVCQLIAFGVSGGASSAECCVTGHHLLSMTCSFATVRHTEVMRSGLPGMCEVRVGAHRLGPLQ